MKTTIFNLNRISLFVTLALTAGAASADQFQDYARVRSVTPEYERINSPREECSVDYVQTSSPSYSYSNGRSYGGSIIGGITGAIVGNQIGKGHGREVATAVGAITGTIVGDRIANNSRGYSNNSPQEVRRCWKTDRWESRMIGYRVIYDYAGRQYSTIMPYDPGREMRVKVSVSPL